MRVTVRQHGGLFDVDQTTEVAGSVARLLEGGELTAERRLARSVRAKLDRLAGTCADALEAAESIEGAPSRELEATGGVADSMATTVEIDRGGDTRTITFLSGDDVPTELYELVAAVLEAPHRDPGTRWAR